MIVPRGSSGEVVCFTKYEPSLAALEIAGNRQARGPDRRVVGSDEQRPAENDTGSPVPYVRSARSRPVDQ